MGHSYYVEPVVCRWRHRSCLTRKAPATRATSTLSTNSRSRLCLTTSTNGSSATSSNRPAAAHTNCIDFSSCLINIHRPIGAIAAFEASRKSVASLKFDAILTCVHFLLRKTYTGCAKEVRRWGLRSVAAAAQRLGPLWADAPIHLAAEATGSVRSRPSTFWFLWAAFISDPPTFGPNFKHCIGLLHQCSFT